MSDAGWQSWMVGGSGGGSSSGSSSNSLPTTLVPTQQPSSRPQSQIQARQLENNSNTRQAHPQALLDLPHHRAARQQLLNLALLPQQRRLGALRKEAPELKKCRERSALVPQQRRLAALHKLVGAQVI